jgi:hypothetical protein
MFIKKFWGLAIAPIFLISACSITAVRPSQEMSNLEVSLRAAKEVNADVLAPELYRSAQETATKARREYRYKNFEIAKKYADQGRIYAERAEFEALRNGAKREAIPTDPLSEPSYAPVPIGTPDPNAPAPTAPGTAPGTGSPKVP